MNKELEALNRMRDNLVFDNYYDRSGNGYNDYELLKSALERKEKLEKAWEIVKTKEVNTADFRESLLSFDMTYKHYVNNYKNYSWELLTETEFNLLKEMLEEK